MDDADGCCGSSICNRYRDLLQIVRPADVKLLYDARPGFSFRAFFYSIVPSFILPFFSSPLPPMNSVLLIRSVSKVDASEMECFSGTETLPDRIPVIGY